MHTTHKQNYMKKRNWLKQKASHRGIFPNKELPTNNILDQRNASCRVNKADRYTDKQTHNLRSIVLFFRPPITIHERRKVSERQVIGWSVSQAFPGTLHALLSRPAFSISRHRCECACTYVRASVTSLHATPLAHSSGFTYTPSLSFFFFSLFAKLRLCVNPFLSLHKSQRPINSFFLSFSVFILLNLKTGDRRAIWPWRGKCNRGSSFTRRSIGHKMST